LSNPLSGEHYLIRNQEAAISAFKNLRAWQVRVAEPMTVFEQHPTRTDNRKDLLLMASRSGKKKFLFAPLVLLRMGRCIIDSISSLVLWASESAATSGGTGILLYDLLSKVNDSECIGMYAPIANKVNKEERDGFLRNNMEGYVAGHAYIRPWKSERPNFIGEGDILLSTRDKTLFERNITFNFHTRIGDKFITYGKEKKAFKDRFGRVVFKEYAADGGPMSDDTLADDVGQKPMIISIDTFPRWQANENRGYSGDKVNDLAGSLRR